MYINYDYYRIFYYVAKYGSFTQAAHALMNNQPNVTRTVKNLENELGCTLFVRSHRGVRFTPEGEKLYAHIKIAIEQIQEGEEELSRNRTLQSGMVAISVSEVALRCFLLPILKEYQQQHPNIRLRVGNHSTPQAVAALKSGRADLALVTTPTGPLDHMTVQNVKEIHEAPVCGTALSHLAKMEQLSLSSLAEYPLVSLGFPTKTYDFYSQWFLSHGLAFKPDVEASTADQILPLVKNNLGVGFVPEEFLAEEDPAAVFRLNLAEPVPPRWVCIIKKDDLSLSFAARELEGMILHAAEISHLE